MVTQHQAAQKAKKSYATPKLTKYGDMRSLTQSASSGDNECGNSGAMKVCRP